MALRPNPGALRQQGLNGTGLARGVEVRGGEVSATLRLIVALRERGRNGRKSRRQLNPGGVAALIQPAMPRKASYSLRGGTGFSSSA